MHYYSDSFTEGSSQVVLNSLPFKLALKSKKNRVAVVKSPGDQQGIVKDYQKSKTGL